MWLKLLKIISVGFDITDQLLIKFFCIHLTLEKKWEYSETVHQLFTDFKKACDSLRRELLCNILIEFGVPMKPVRLIEMCFIEICSKVHIRKHLSDTFSVQNDLKWGDALSQLLFDLALEYAIRKVQEKMGRLNYIGHISCCPMPVM
jgi:hypothetical protein